MPPSLSCSGASCGGARGRLPSWPRDASGASVPFADGLTVPTNVPNPLKLSYTGKVGPDAKPCSQCKRTDFGKPYSAAAETALLKLKYLEKSRAAGNR